MQSAADILVVDDDSETRVVLRDALELNGYTVITVESGPAGLQCLRDLPPPRLVLLDFSMPGMDGEEFLQQINRNPRYPFVPVVMLSATPGVASIPGARALLPKPFELDELLNLVSHYVRTGPISC